MSTEWSMERVGAQFLREVQEAFERENAAYRAEETVQLERLKDDPTHVALIARDPSYADAMTVRDSFYWEIYSRAAIQVVNNSVKIILPQDFAIYADFIEMFEKTSVGWSRANVGAEVIDGEPRVIIELFLIDYWDDDRAAAWLLKNQPAQEAPDVR